ncbi:hypothetical protein ACFLWA_02800 [Chloroflexota bacterium]
MSQDSQAPGRAPVLPSSVRVEGIGLQVLDRRRVDVAVDLTPCREPLTVELVIVGPTDDELCSILLVETRVWMLDKIMHLRHDSEPGEHTIHVGVFHQNALLVRAARTFSFANVVGLLAS